MFIVEIVLGCQSQHELSIQLCIELFKTEFPLFSSSIKIIPVNEKSQIDQNRDSDCSDDVVGSLTALISLKPYINVSNFCATIQQSIAALLSFTIACTFM